MLRIRTNLSAASVLAFVLVLVLGGAGRAAAQGCSGPGWLPGDGVPGVDGTVLTSINWFSDGIGLQSPVIVVGGNFRTAGREQATGVAAYDPATGVWSALGAGPARNATVRALAVLPDGTLVAGGHFSSARGGLPGVARWTGSAWEPIGDSPFSCSALTVLPTGELVAARELFRDPNRAEIDVARWDGARWQPLAGRFEGRSTGVQALTVLPGGELVVGGSFDSVDGVNARGVARWDGSTWSPLGLGIDGLVSALQPLPGGDLVAAGDFRTAGGVEARNIARWNGSSWAPVGFGIDGPVTALAPLSGGQFIAGGYFSRADGRSARSLARWDGRTWLPMGSGAAASRSRGGSGA
jgi:trimeric autotransporter adhesin